VPIIQNKVDLFILQDENATVVEARTSWGHFATGSSKRMPGDSKDLGRAYRLATARSLIRLGRGVLKQEGGRQY